MVRLYGHEWMWPVYQLFHDPPTQPKQLECVNCRLALGATSVTLVGAFGYGAKRFARKNIYVCTGFCFAGFAAGGLALIFFKNAKQATENNELLIKRWQTEKQLERKERRAIMKQINSGETPALANQ